MAVCTEEEFIALFDKLKSAQKVADELGINVRNVHARRRKIESRRGILLEASDPRYKPPVWVSVEQKRQIAQLELFDGVMLIASDAHYWPGEVSTAHRGFVHLAKKLKPEAVVMNGDVFDGASISRWGSIGWEQKPSVRQELEAVVERLQEIVEAAPNAKRFWTIGNHDIRFETRLAAVASEFGDLPGFKITDHVFGWMQCWRLDVNDNVVIRHREAGGEHADWNNVVKAGKTIVTGHDHRIGAVPYHDYSGLRYGVRTGMLADNAGQAQFNNYLEAKEPNWHSGFIVLTFKEGRLLTPEICRKWDEGVIEFRGELIEV